MSDESICVYVVVRPWELSDKSPEAIDDIIDARVDVARDTLRNIVGLKLGRDPYRNWEPSEALKEAGKRYEEKTNKETKA